MERGAVAVGEPFHLRLQLVERAAVHPVFGRIGPDSEPAVRAAAVADHRDRLVGGPGDRRNGRQDDDRKHAGQELSHRHHLLLSLSDLGRNRRDAAGA